MTATAQTEKDLSVTDFLPKVLPVLDVIFIVLIACFSSAPWITTPIQLAIPVFGLMALRLFREKGRAGFIMVGIVTIVPIFILNMWGGPTVPTWLTEFNFIAGGLLLSKGLLDELMVLFFVLASTIIPFELVHIPFPFLIMIVIAELAVWFLLQRSMAFMKLQQNKISAQKRVIEEKQKEILDSIHYAKRIQRSLLPSESYLERKINRKKGEG